MSRVEDRWAASDPGLVRLMTALHAVTGIALTFTVLALQHMPAESIGAGCFGALTISGAGARLRVGGGPPCSPVGAPLAMPATCATGSTSMPCHRRLRLHGLTVFPARMKR